MRANGLQPTHYLLLAKGTILSIKELILPTQPSCGTSRPISGLSTRRKAANVAHRSVNVQPTNAENIAPKTRSSTRRQRSEVLGALARKRTVGPESRAAVVLQPSDARRRVGQTAATVAVAVARPAMRTPSLGPRRTVAAGEDWAS